MKACITTTLAATLSLHLEEDNSQLIPWSQQEPLVFGKVRRSSISRYLGKTLVSNVVLSCSAKAKKGNTYLDDIMSLDTDSYTIAIDTCTTFHICKHRELFVGQLKDCSNIFIQGVGGRTRVQGYGSIKLRVTDNSNQLHELIINDVLYVPDSPTNLLSPQRWSQDSSNPKGTGEITVSGTTVLFWNDTKTTKLVIHHPELGIPIISINDGYTKSAAFLNTCVHQPPIPSYLTTSQEITDNAN